jgi:uncharacterized protein (DUF362 family)
MKFQSYEETVPKILKIIKLDKELKKHQVVILKPTISADSAITSTPKELVKAVAEFCMEHKNPVTDIFIAEGVDGADTLERFEELGYNDIAEKLGIGLIDLNDTETEILEPYQTEKFEEVIFPKILMNSFVISLPKLFEDEEIGLNGSLSGMLGAYPSSYYKGFFSKTKTKIKKHPIKYSIHDILMCKMPDLALIDASEFGMLIAGKPLEADKFSAKLFGREWNEYPHLRLISERFSDEPKTDTQDELNELIGIK